MKQWFMAEPRPGDAKDDHAGNDRAAMAQVLTRALL
jgi:hypothetical protein